MNEEILDHGESFIVELEFVFTLHLHVGSDFLQEHYVIIKIGELLRCIEYQESFENEFRKILLGWVLNGLES